MKNSQKNKEITKTVESNDLFEEFMNQLDKMKVNYVEHIFQQRVFKGKKSKFTTSPACTVDCKFGFFRISPTEKGIELSTIVVYDEYRNKGIGKYFMSIIVNCVCAALVALDEDNIEIDDMTFTLSATPQVHFANRIFRSPLRNKVELYKKFGFVVYRRSIDCVDMIFKPEREHIEHSMLYYMTFQK